MCHDPGKTTLLWPPTETRTRRGPRLHIFCPYHIPRLRSSVLTKWRNVWWWWWWWPGSHGRPSELIVTRSTSFIDPFSKGTRKVYLNNYLRWTQENLTGCQITKRLKSRKGILRVHCCWGHYLVYRKRPNLLESCQRIYNITFNVRSCLSISLQKQKGNV